MISPSQQPCQEGLETYPTLTCTAMRADELRVGLVREISHVIAIGLQAQAALLDGDDETALACLRRTWNVLRVEVGPRAAELGSLP